MSLIEDQEVDLADLHKGIEQSLIEDFRRAHDDHILCELITPGLLIPEIRAHGTENMCHILIKVLSEHGRLLENEGHAINLRSVSTHPCHGSTIKYQEKCHTGGFPICPVDQLALQDVFEKEHGDQCFPRP